MLVSLLRSQLARCYPVSIAATSIGSMPVRSSDEFALSKGAFGDTWNKPPNPATPRGMRGVFLEAEP
jgi:hypothetical protein